MRKIAELLIWLFFLLVFNDALGIAAKKYGVLPGRLSYYYGVITIGLFVTAALSYGLRHLRNEWPFFVPLAALVMLGALMYRMDAGPDFGGKILLPEYTPSRLSYVAWPILNFMTAASLYLFSARDDLRATIRGAVFATLILQAGTMEADMWWPALFGDPNGRAGGLTQNANTAALLVTVLASMMLPSRKREPFNSFAIYAALIAVAAVIFAQSKTGALSAASLIAGFAFAKLQGSRGGLPKPIFVATYLAAIAATVWLSPVLNGTVPFPKPMFKGLQLGAASEPAVAPVEVSLKEAETTIHPPATEPEHFSSPGAIDSPMPLSERLKSRTSIDESFVLRWDALLFYLDILKDHATGLGTGFTNKFVTGPHNSFLKLAVDNGYIAPVILIVVLTAVTWRALTTRSPQLLSLSLIAWITATFFHTVMVDPIVFPALAIGLGMLSETGEANNT